MKQITLDFELYQQELKAARLEGFNLRPKMIEDIERLVSSLDDIDYNVRYTAKVKIYDILYLLKEGNTK